MIKNDIESVIPQSFSKTDEKEFHHKCLILVVKKELQD